MRDDFCALVLTHGRADRVHTMGTLGRAGYTGPTYLVVDDEDAELPEYERRYPGQVVTFSKSDAMRTTDTMDNFARRDIVVYARNQAHGIARDLGYRYFIELDDDYSRFDYRRVEGDKLASIPVRDMDALLGAMVEFLEASGALSVAMMQAGDFIGGAENTTVRKGWQRKVMNSFVCSVERPFKFLGSINEDVNAYVSIGGRGGLFLSPAAVSLVQRETQANAGGLTDVYLALGTYVKSFYSVMCRPDCVTVKDMGEEHRRLHHKVSWNECVPKIVPERLRKT